MNSAFELLSPDGHPIFVASLPNVRGGMVHHEFVRNAEELEQFRAAYDHPGRALYWAVARIALPAEGVPLVGVNGSQRCKDNVIDTHVIWAETDFKDHPNISPDQIIRDICDTAKPTPSFVVLSGHSVHPYWLLKQREDASPGEGQRRIEEILKLACRHIGGDSHVSEVARLMRLPGSHNTRIPGENLPVELKLLNGCQAYTLDELQDAWLTAEPVLPSPKGEPSHPFEWTEPLTTDAELAAMRFKAPEGKPNIHQTQLRASCKMLNDGEPVAKVTASILAATKQAVVGDERCLNWDWQKEEHDILAMCFSWINKAAKAGEDLSHTLPDELYKKWRSIADSRERPVITFNRYGVVVRRSIDNKVYSAVDGPPPKKEFILPPKQETPPQRKGAALSVKEWMERAVPEPAFCLGSWLTTTSRALIYAPTGIGKSLLAVAIAFAVSDGNIFLHWAARPKLRVLYIDGEMAQRLLKRRIVEEATRSNSQPETLFAVNTGDIDDFKPLDDPRGRAAVEDEIKAIGGVDLIFFDNIMALLGGDMKDEESWRKTLEWQKSLTRRQIGQIWIHHTGHDETKGYGTKTREWQMDTVIALEPVERPETDVSFILTFKKARERTPETRSDFKDVRISLINNRWEYDIVAEDERRKPSPMAEKFRKALINALASDEAVYYRGQKAVRLEAWRRECVTMGLVDPDRAHSARTLLSKYRRELIQCNQVACHEDLTWLM